MKTFLISITLFIFISLGTDSFSQEQAVDYPDDFIMEYMAEKHIAGMSAVIVIGDSVMWKNHYGYAIVEDSLPVTDTTLFNIFSISKLITAVCQLQCWENNMIGLDENINEFMPFFIDNPHLEDDNFSVRDLMTHTSSIYDYKFHDYTIDHHDPTMSLAYMMENYLSEGGDFYDSHNFLNRVPGEYYSYSNFGVALNGLVVEQISGIDYANYSKDSLFQPLNMDRTAWFLNDLDTNNLAPGYYYAFNRYNKYPHQGNPAYPGVSCRSTALELSNLLIMLMNDGIYKDEVILQPKTIDTMCNVYLTESGNGIGLGIYKKSINGQIVWGHNGGGQAGYAAHFYMCPGNNTGVVITTNSSHYPTPVLDELFDYASLLTSVSEKPKVSEIEAMVYPNPSTIRVTVAIECVEFSNCMMTMFNQYGLQVRPTELEKLNPGKTYINLNISDLRAGIYFIRLQIGNETMTKKIVKL